MNPPEEEGQLGQPERATLFFPAVLPFWHTGDRGRRRRRCRGRVSALSCTSTHKGDVKHCTRDELRKHVSQPSTNEVQIQDTARQGEPEKKGALGQRYLPFFVSPQ